MNGFVVELCGLPGSGKSTFAHQLLDRLRETGVPVSAVDGPVSASAPRYRRLPRKAVLVGQALTTHPRTHARAARVVGAGQPTGRDKVAMPVRWCVAGQLLERASRFPGAALLDEGLVQALWSVGLRSRSVSVPDLLTLVTTAARPDLVVHLDVPVDLALERMMARSSRHSRVQQLQPSEQREELQKGDALLRGLLTEWSRQGISPVNVVTPSAEATGEAVLPITTWDRLLAAAGR